MRSGTALTPSLFSLFSFAVAACASDPPPPPVAPPTQATPTPVVTATPPAPTSDPVAKDPAPVKKTFAASTPTNELSLAMLRALKGEKGNVFFSAASLRGALGMAALGAKGPTREEMVTALGLGADPAKDATSAKAEQAAWKSGAGKADLVIANRLWVEKSFPLDKGFSKLASDGYGASAEGVDFQKGAEASRGRINKWVSDTTKGKIENLLPQGSVDPLTRVVLTNAIYFKGNWAEAFKKEATKDAPFQASSGVVNVPTMYRMGQMSSGTNDEVDLVQLPYKDSDLAMLIALPKQTSHLAAIESEVSGGEVDAWAKSLTSGEVALFLPKFTFSWGRSVKRELEGLGIKTAFGNAADFSGVAPTGKDLKISDVFHKAFVLVDETGTEAAAATGAVMTVKSVHVPAKTIKVDHPFLFFVRNAKTGEILFAGRVADPKA